VPGQLAEAELSHFARVGIEQGLIVSLAAIWGIDPDLSIWQELLYRLRSEQEGDNKIRT
jgi:hypothetical protein